MQCTATTRKGKRCTRPATRAFVQRFDWRAACAQHRSYFASSTVIEIALDQLGPWLSGQYVQGAHRNPTQLERYQTAQYLDHVNHPITTPHLTDELLDAVAHGYSGTLD